MTSVEQGAPVFEMALLGGQTLVRPRHTLICSLSTRIREKRT